ncbi:hypothetical protein JOF29_000053 [Kribbella aluminosa]|uniref:DUF2784 domain-containing protein n=1 Tax=Kribbella aluminosa TaxID=416017 RepID=A0ABS4UBF1_9ACTN|nr:hypothetical protein [Kribbella aluminosa]
MVWAHLFIAVWNLTIVSLDFGCPLTVLEKYFRRRGGEQVYAGGYIQHYLKGTIWPEGATPVAEKVGFALLLISYVGLVVLRRARKRATTSP